MKKTELLAQIESSTKGIAKVEPVMVNPTTPEVVEMQNGKTARKYTVNVAVNQGETVTFQNLPIIVFNEGLADEEAVLSQGQEAPKAKDIETKVQTYLQGKVTDGTFFGFTLIAINENFKYAIASVIENVAGVATKKSVFVYKPTGNPITHIAYAE
jgi:hypothetical protein